MLGIRPGALSMLSLESKSEPYPRVGFGLYQVGLWIVLGLFGQTSLSCFVCFGAMLAGVGF